MNKTDKFEWLPVDGLNYEIDEVDNRMYMFNKNANGLLFSASCNLGKLGHVTLDGREVEYEVIFLKNSWIKYKDYPCISVKVRGVITEYDRQVKIGIYGFGDEHGNSLPKFEFTVNVMPRRNCYDKKYEYRDGIAYTAAAESMVLLKNSGVLPLEKGSVLNLFGRGASEYRYSAIGAGKINPRHCRNLFQAIDETSDFKYNEELAKIYRCPNDEIPDDGVLKRAKEMSDTAIIVITRGSGENIDNRPDKGEYYLSDKENLLIEKLCSVFSDTVVILNTAYPIDVRFIEKNNISACIYAGISGMFSAEALTDILSGKVTPCGHLADTWPLDYYDMPSSVNFLNFKNGEEVLQTDDLKWSNICYEEGMYVGYRYFSSFGKKCAYPFGYGLSYTDFTVNFDNAIECDGEIVFDFTVKNTGNYKGKEVVELYASKPEKTMEQPKLELVGFEKTPLLNPSESIKIKISVPIEHLKSYDVTKAAWVLCGGEFEFSFGKSALDVIKICVFKNEHERVILKSDRYSTCNIPYKVMNKTDKPFPTGEFTAVSDKNEWITGQAVRQAPKSNVKPCEKTVYFEEVKEDLSLLPAFVAQMTDEELCRLNVCSNRSWSMDAKGEAGWTFGFEKYHLPPFALADGNNGVNVFEPNIGMPASNMIAQSFDKNLAYKVGEAIALEMKDYKINIALGPAMNLHRSILNGRHIEYFSEDPFLGGVMAGYQNKGFQDGGISGCIKHVIANNCEAVRKRSNSVIDERTMRELYLRIFEYANEVEPSDTLMTGYNAVNNCFTDENYELIENIFYGELNFNGFVMSDWNSYDTSDAAKMVAAGVSFLTPGCDDDSRVIPLVLALKDGKITRDMLERNITRLLGTIIKRINREVF